MSVKSKERFRKTGEHRFRRIRKDGTLGEEVLFEMGLDGRAVKFTQHSNHLRRVSRGAPATRDPGLDTR